MIKHLVGLGLLALAASAQAADVKVMMQTTETAIGSPIDYPAGKAMITSVDVTLYPGETNGWHSHPVPTFGYQLSGTLTVYYEGGEKRVFEAGTTIVEAEHIIHMGVNEGTEPVRLIVFYAGAEGMPTTHKAPDYKPLDGQPQ